MGKNTQGGRNAARAAAQARAAELRAIQARKDKQRKQMTIASTVMAVVVIVAAVAIGIGMNKGKEIPNPSSTTGGATAAKIVADLTSIPQATFDAVGVGSSATSALPRKVEGGTLSTVDGLPKVLYIGAEYCPYCAMERWSLIAALARFGTFEGLELSTSPAEQTIDPVPTLTFLNAKYTSTLLHFTAYETKDTKGQPLQTPSAEDQTAFTKLNSQGSIPFTLYGGTGYDIGATYDESLLMTQGSFMQDKTAAEINSALADPKSEIAQAVLGSANIKTAYLCTLTGGKPAAVCTSPGVKAAAAKLP